MRKQTKKLVYGAMLAAIAVVLTFFVRFPIFPAMSFLEYDMGDVPLFVSAVTLGPWYGLLITAVACVVQGLTVSAESSFIGIIMHFLATGAFVLCAGLMTRKRKTSLHVIPAFICGAITQILIMIPLNLIFTSAFVGGDVAAAAKVTVECLVAFPHNASAVLCGIAFAVAFIAAFAIALIYAGDDKNDNSKRKLFGLKRTLTAVIAGLFYSSIILLVMNLLFANIVFTDPSVNTVREMLFIYCVPFNAIKAAANSVIAYVLYVAIFRRLKL